jgi:SAM-dependent methyltransferase
LTSLTRVTSDKVRGLWRLYLGLRPRTMRAIVELPRRGMRFFRDWQRFRRAGGKAMLRDIAPVVIETGAATQSGGGHYFFQDVWALHRLRQFGPREHHDFGSRLDGFTAQATAICSIFYYDIRPPGFELPRFIYREADLLHLPLEDQCLSSVSCLHVAEHVGLGRYGDKIDPEGAHKAFLELARVLAPGGQLLLSVPVGRDRVEFNAQRIWHPLLPIRLLSDLHLQEFSVVTDDDVFVEYAHPDDFAAHKYACGLYRFIR